MNCEQVGELLSIYLDNKLAFEDRQSVAHHLHFCTTCSTLLADFHRFDTLLARLPRIEPRQSLEERIFSSPEYRELTGTWDGHYPGSYYKVPIVRRLRDEPGRPKLVALPGGRLKLATEGHDATTLPGLQSPDPLRCVTPASKGSMQRKREGSGASCLRYRQKRRHRILAFLRVVGIAVVVSIFIMISVGSLVGWHLWSRHPQHTHSSST